MRFARAETRAAEASEDDDALYEIAWQRIPAQRPSEPRAAAGSWLPFADDAGTADALAARIEAVGGTCCRVSAGDVFERTSNCSWVINPAKPRTFRVDFWRKADGTTAMRSAESCTAGISDVVMTERNASPAQCAGVTWLLGASCIWYRHLPRRRRSIGWRALARDPWCPGR